MSAGLTTRAIVLGLLAALSLAGCAKTRDRQPFVATVHAATNGCVFRVAELEVTLDQLSVIAGREASKTRRAQLRGDGETPYRCVGAAIYTLQRAGFRAVDFRTDPPPPAP
jgi:biopolymer transport protein ExbD